MYGTAWLLKNIRLFEDPQLYASDIVWSYNLLKDMPESYLAQLPAQTGHTVAGLE